MGPMMRRDGRIGALRGGEDETHLVLHQEVARPVPHTGFGAAIARQLEPERGAVVVARLLGVPDVELDVVGAVDRERVSGLGGLGGEDLSGHGVLRLGRSSGISYQLSATSYQLAKLAHPDQYVQY